MERQTVDPGRQGGHRPAMKKAPAGALHNTKCAHSEANKPLNGENTVPEVGLELHSRPCQHWELPKTWGIRSSPRTVRPSQRRRGVDIVNTPSCAILSNSFHCTGMDSDACPAVDNLRTWHRPNRSSARCEPGSAARSETLEITVKSRRPQCFPARAAAGLHGALHPLHQLTQ